MMYALLGSKRLPQALVTDTWAPSRITRCASSRSAMRTQISGRLWQSGNAALAAENQLAEFVYPVISLLNVGKAETVGAAGHSGG